MIAHILDLIFAVAVVMGMIYAAAELVRLYGWPKKIHVAEVVVGLILIVTAANSMSTASVCLVLVVLVLFGIEAAIKPRVPR